MRPLRWLAPLMILLLVAACGGSAGASNGGDGNGGNGGESQAADTPEPAESEGGGNGGNGGNGGSSGDIEQLADDLTPPNATEISRTTAEGAIWVTYESSDSADSLANFYESAIAGTGLTIYSTTTVEGTYSWLFAEDGDASGFGGSVTVAPMDGASGSTVIILLAPGS